MKIHLNQNLLAVHAIVLPGGRGDRMSAS